MAPASLSIDDASSGSLPSGFAGAAGRWTMPATAIVLVLLTLLAVVKARGWPLVHDAPLMHYVVFLMQHGRAPYRDIVEMNMPGTYMVEWAAMRVFGGGAFGWLLYDTLLGAAAIGVSAWIAGRGRRWAGVAGGAMVYLIHLHEGANQRGQRDWMVAVVLLVAFGCLFEAIRQRVPAWMAGFMGLVGVAAAVKPPVLVFGLFFLVATCWLIRKRQKEPRRVQSEGEIDAAGLGGSKNAAWPQFAVWGITGGLSAASMVVFFLLRWGVVHDFLANSRGLVAWYAGLQRLPLWMLFARAIGVKQSVLFIVAAAGIVVWNDRARHRTWESYFLAAAAIGGMALFVAQGKGWAYHVYPEIVFAALWAMIELDGALRRSRLEQTIAFVALAGTLAVMVPLIPGIEYGYPYASDGLIQLEGDLNRLGGSELSGRVQCLDMTMGGCINVLYRMKLVQATGFIYDFYLFPQQTNVVTSGLQTRFMSEVTANPPKVIVISSHTWPGDTLSYNQMDNWPAFAELLQRSYRLESERPKPAVGAGYRIYVLKQ